MGDYNGWAVFAIGSAGHGTGRGKAKASNGELSVQRDVEECKSWIGDNLLNPHWYGEYVVSQRVGYAKHCIEELVEFFKYCARNKYDPLIYYTGHGDTNGDWCFPCGKVSFADVKKAAADGGCTRWPVILSDCCYSGKWVWLGKQQEAHVMSAAGADEEAYDRVFAQAVFKNSKTKQDELWKYNAMTTTWTDTVEVKWFRGNEGVFVGA